MSVSLEQWLFVLIYGVIVFPLWYHFAIWNYKRKLKQKETKFLKAVRVKFPEADDIFFTSVETSNQAAMEDLVRQVGLEGPPEEKEWVWPT